MTSAEGIRKYGFHRWYERQLIEGHLYLVTSFLSFIMVFACFEEFNIRAPGFKPFMMLALMIGGAILCAASLRRYLSVLVRTQQLAGQSVYSRCGTYGRLQVNGSTSFDGEAGTASLQVQCRQCGHQWTMRE